MSVGLIVGTGVSIAPKSDSWLEVATPYGAAYTATIDLGGREVVLVRRHGPGLNIPPHLISYKANIWALKQLGADRVIATAAVGSLRRDMAPGTLSVISDFIDFTKRRSTTFLEEPRETVVHTDFSVPYCPEISAALEQAATVVGATLGPRSIYVCVDGPRYETPAEIRMFAGWGGDVVGMTGVPEVVLARELGMCYGALAMITNYAAGISEKPLTHQEVVECMTEHRQQVNDVLLHAISGIPEKHACECRP